jgi:hypothetical protein
MDIYAAWPSENMPARLVIANTPLTEITEMQASMIRES